jgi:hypothetical protein
MGGSSSGVRPPNLWQRLGLWGVAATLLAFSFWPLAGSVPIHDIVYGPLQSLVDGPGLIAKEVGATR